MLVEIKAIIARCRIEQNCLFRSALQHLIGFPDSEPIDTVFRKQLLI